MAVSSVFCMVYFEFYGKGHLEYIIAIMIAVKK
jgi:hypothetical protein